jgi:hypothetical protein
MVDFKNSRVFPIALVVIIVIVAVAALISLARAVFFSGSSTQPLTSQEDNSREALLSSAVGRSVSMSVRGPIVADEEFRSYEIVVTPNSRSLTTYSGYIKQPISQTGLGNNIPAYENFVYSLARADLAEGTALEGDDNDTRGVCATGKLYEFTISNDNQTVERLWTTTCRDARGSLDANRDQLTQLFVKQIPDGSDAIRAEDL